MTTYYKQLTEIAEYFSYIDKCADVKFNLNEMCDGIESDSNINMPENIKKDIYDLMYNVSVEVEVKDNTLVVSFDKLFADNSTFTYKINICLNKKPEYKYQYVIGVVSLKRLLNQSNLKSWSSKMIKKSLEAYFFTLKNKIVFCKKQFQNMSVFCFVSTEIV